MALAEVRQLRAARPSIWVDGQSSAKLTLGLERCEIIEHTDGLYRCEATVCNWGPTSGGVGHLYFGRDLVDFGKSFDVKIDSDQIFSGLVMGLEGRFPEGGAPTVVVLAEDELQELRMTRRTRAFENVSDSDVFSQIAQDHSLTPDISLSGGTYKVLAQVNQSDLAFLRDRARAIDAELWLDGSTLHAAQRSDRQSSPIKLVYGAKLRSFTVLADLAHQRTKLTVGGWDVSSKEAIQSNADSSVVSGEVSGMDSGPSILSSALGDREECIVHAVPHTSDEAQAIAQGQFRHMARRFVVAHGVTDTEAGLRVGATVDVGGVGPLFNGKYYLREVRHVFDAADGMRSEWVAERAGLGKP